MLRAMLRHREGFTVIELLIVVVIIGILLAIAIPKFANNKSKTYQAAMKSDLVKLVRAQEAYFTDSSKYATSAAQLKFQGSPGVSAPAIVTGQGFWTATVTHSQLPGVVCSVGVNTANPTVGAGATENEPACK